MAPERQLVLELVLPRVSDVKTMVACTLVSTEVKHHTHRAVKENLPALISACHYDRYEQTNTRKPIKYQPFLWLRSVSGDSWRSFEAGCAMLEKVVEEAPLVAADFLVYIGLQLTRELLMHLMRKRRSYPNLLAAYLDHKGAAANMPTVYMEAATWGWCWINGELFPRAHKPVDYLVARVKPAQLPDVLLLLVLQAVNEQPAAEAALALIQRDKEVLHVLHHGRRAGSNSSSSSQGGGAAGCGSSQQGSSGVPGWLVKWWKVSSKAAREKEKQQQQQQQELTQQQAVRIVEEVLTVCVTYDMVELCQAVAALPAAQHIGAAKVTQLLYVAFMQLKKRPHYAGPSMPVLEALVALPGAADVSPECFEHLLRMCVLKKDATKLGPVLKLPCLQQLTSQQLCRVIYIVGQAGFKTPQELFGFAEGRSLLRENLLNLIKKVINNPWDFAYDSITRCLELLEVLKPGQILTGDDVLTLMEECVSCSSYRKRSGKAATPDVSNRTKSLYCYLLLAGRVLLRKEGWDGLLLMAKWVPAAAAVTDVPRFVAVVKSATTCWHPDSGTGVATTLLSAMPVTQQLQPSDWVLLVKSVLMQRGGEGFLKWALQQQPELQHMSAEDISELLTVAATHRRNAAAAVLAALPAAQQLGSSDLAELLTTAARVAKGADTLKILTTLPGVEQLGPAVLADALTRAVRHGGAANAEVLASVPAAQQLEGAVVGELLLTAAKQGPACVQVVLTLPAAAEVQPGVCAEALSALLPRIKQEGKYGDGRRACEAFTQLCALPVAQQMQGEAVQQLLDVVTDMGNEGMGLLESLSQLPQAAGMQAQLSSARLLPLLKQAVNVCYWNRSAEVVENMRQLLQKPAAQELGGADFLGLLKTAASREYKEAFAALQQLRGFRELDSQAVLGLLRWALEHTNHGDLRWLEAFAQHPAAASIKSEQLTNLISLGVQKYYNSAEKYRLLLQLPSMRQLDAAGREELMRVCIRQRDTDVLRVLLEQPGVGSIDVAGATRLLDAARWEDEAKPAYGEARLTKAIVTGLPAVADMKAEDMLKLLWETIVMGQERVTEALSEAPVFPEAVGKGGVELAALCGAVKLLEHRTYPDPPDD